MIVSVEIGGTFTDLIAVSDGTIVQTLKVPSTPFRPEIGVLDALRELNVDLSSIQRFIHGSTIATNAVVERKGAKVGLITTRGFRDILEIQRGNRADIYDIFYTKPKPLVSRDNIIEVKERISANGDVLEVLDEDEARKAIQSFIQGNRIESIAISFLHSHKNHKHEQRMKELLEEAECKIPISLSSEIIPEFREYERTSATVINAYMAPIVEKYLLYLEREMASSGFSGDIDIVQSNGGILPAPLARKHGLRILLSGPAAGVIAATHVAEVAGRDDLISLDMGGTSTDVCLITSGSPQVSTDCKIDGLPLKVPMIDIVTIGAGGGSIAWIDAGGMLRVGPQSAGADPGPVCYAKGGINPTVTDADVVRGFIRAENFLGGKMKLDPSAAESSLDGLAKTLRMDRLQVATAIFKVVDANMAQALRLVSVERGYDPRDYTLVAFGGAGPLHAAHLAEELEIKEVLIPEYPGLLSAYGLLVADFKRDYVQSDISRVNKTKICHVQKVFHELEARANRELFEYNIPLEGCLYAASLDMRYYGQAFELNVPVTLSHIKEYGMEGLLAAFHKAHHRRYGYSSPSEEVEIVNYRLTVSSPRRAPRREERRIEKAEPEVETGRIFLAGKLEECKFVSRSSLGQGFEICGPAVVEEPTATSFIPPGWCGRVDGFRNFILRREGV